MTDYQKFLEDLSSGSYVENSVDSVMLDVDGKRLMCEALYLLGVMLTFMDLKVPGPIREALVIAQYRHKARLPPASMRLLSSFSTVYHNVMDMLVAVSW